MPVLFYFLLLIGTFATLPVHAQVSSLIYGSDALTIELEPNFPGPNSTFVANANDYSLPVQGAGFRWFVDGKLVPEAKNKRELSLMSKSAGESTVLELVVDLPNGSTISAKRTVAPMYLDIIIEPQTRTPAFYKGRALPSIGSQINATAILNGKPERSTDYIYTWQVNGKALEGGSLRGQNVITFPMPRGQFATLSLEVRLPSGETVARRVLDLPSVAPSLAFYEQSTLYGLTERAIGDRIALTGSTLSVIAEPYYLDLATYNDPDFSEWKINNVLYPNQNSNPYEVILAASGGSGQNEIEFHVRNTTQVLQGAGESFLVTF